MLFKQDKTCMAHSYYDSLLTTVGKAVDISRLMIDCNCKLLSGKEILAKPSATSHLNTKACAYSSTLNANVYLLQILGVLFLFCSGRCHSHGFHEGLAHRGLLTHVAMVISSNWKAIS